MIKIAPFLVVTITCLLTAPAWADDAKTNSAVKITAVEAKKYVGKEAIVSGKVAEVYKSEKVVHLNLEKPFPDHPFTAVIFAAKTNLFGDFDKMKGKNVEITGKVVDYRGKPEIVIESTNQLQVVEAPSEADKK
jgi:DNA/RNA endonuclease YhcR with UshA esterase domain